MKQEKHIRVGGGGGVEEDEVEGERRIGYIIKR